MGLPAGVETVTVVSGQPLALPDGTPYRGRLIFKGPDLLTIGEDDVVLGGAVEVPLVDGNFSVDLVPPDASGISPTGWTYEVISRFTNAPNWTRYITLTKTVATVNLADVVVPDPVAGSYSTLVSPDTLLAKAANLSDVADPAQARSHLGLGGAAVLGVGTAAGTVMAGDDSRIAGAVQKAQNLADLPDKSLSRTNLGLGGAAVLNIGTAAGTVMAGDDSRIAGAAQRSQNLADLGNAGTARSNLGLGGAAVLNVGTAAGTVTAGDDSRLSNPRTPLAHAASHASGGSDPITPAGIGGYTAAAGTTLEGRATSLESRATVLELNQRNLPSEQNLLDWTYDPDEAGHVTAQTNAGVAGRITLTRVNFRRPHTISTIWVGVSGVDVSAVLSNCYLGIYDAAGNLKAVTADLSAPLMNSANAKPMGFPVITPFTAVPGFHYMAMLLNGTWTLNNFTFKSSGAGVTANAGLAAPNLRYANMLTGQTALPATLSMAGQTSTIISGGWGSQWYGVA